jgi:hypothetical protein
VLFGDHRGGGNVARQDGIPDALGGRACRQRRVERATREQIGQQPARGR